MSLQRLNEIQTGDTMPFDIVRGVHPEYNEYKDIWEKCRDAYVGEEAIKAKSTKYLPKLNGQNNAEYENYKLRAQFYGATARTVEAYLGMIWRKPTSYRFYHDGEESHELNDFFKEFFKVITSDGKSFDDFAHDVAEDIIVTNRVGVLVDMPYVDPVALERMSLSDYREAGIKPLLSVYSTESIINWHTAVIDNQTIPVLYVLHETITRIPENSLVAEHVNRYRILYLENYKDRKNRRYKVIVAEEPMYKTTADPKTSMEVVEVYYPTVNNEYIRTIPFFILTDRGIGFKKIHKPMISDLASVNIGHYRNSADMENELHFVSLKTVFLPGWDKKAFGNPKVGGAMAAPEGCTPSLMEPSSDSSIREEMILKEQRMAVLGAERISQKSRYLPSAETARITASTESSVLSNMVLHLSETLTSVVQFLVDWAKPSITEFPGKLEVRVQISDDFYDDLITGADALNWVNVYQQGGISLPTLFYNLERREAYPKDWTMQKEISALEGTNELIMRQAMGKITEGETNNPFFRKKTSDGTSSDKGRRGHPGVGADVTPQIRADRTRSRIR